MDITTIGKEIAALRKEQGLKQEEVAKQVGVSPQAVSKWENGSMPDTELLPKIADVFGVSIDRLFGRSMEDYRDIETALMKKLAGMPGEERIKAAFEYCWDMEMALYGTDSKDLTIEKIAEGIGEKKQQYSSILRDEGFTRMGLANRLQYFLLVPEMKDTEAALFDDIDYVGFFKDFSDQDVFDACVLLHKRNQEKAFTPSLLVKKLKLDENRAVEILKILEKYQMISRTQIEIDDEIQEIYSFHPTPSFVALLIFAQEIIKAPHNFRYYWMGRSKPYLQ